MQKIVLIILLSIFFINAQDQIYPPPTSLVTIPTAGSLNRGVFSVSMRMQKDGGLLNSLSVGFSDRFMFGISLGASNLIGDKKPIPNPRPELMIKYRFIDESIVIPALSLGIDSQGFGSYNEADSVRRYDVKGYGLYLVSSKNWKTLLGNMGLHFGINYNLTESIDKDEDLNFFTGIDIEFNPEFSFLIEYNAALNQNNMTAKTISMSRGGFLNTGLRFSIFQNLHLDIHFNNLLFDEQKVNYYNREVKINYIEYF